MVKPTFAQDSVRALAAYLEAGMHIEPDVLDAQTCDELIAIANDFPAVKAGDYRTVLQPHRKADAFLRALHHPRVTGFLSRVLGGKISGIQTQFFYGKPGTPGFQPHQDNRFVNAPPGKFASAWVALTDVSKENGGLYIYPGSFRESLLEVDEVEAPETTLQDANALRLRCHVPSKYTAVDLNMKKGSVAFFDGHTVHGSHANSSRSHRYALLMTYIARGAPFVPGIYAQREEIPID
jgi:ectoine hydroxylase-related dioxygenase (phytanoyl-CoA dioxygenase family)